MDSRFGGVPWAAAPGHGYWGLRGRGVGEVEEGRVGRSGVDYRGDSAVGDAALGVKATLWGRCNASTSLSAGGFARPP